MSKDGKNKCGICEFKDKESATNAIANRRTHKPLQEIVKNPDNIYVDMLQTKEQRKRFIRFLRNKKQ